MQIPIKIENKHIIENVKKPSNPFMELMYFRVHMDVIII
jgi:hypothetical protein